ncbi:MAG: hypothetical protein ACO3QK_08165, partial [Flavobacteriaceae bacterium]
LTRGEKLSSIASCFYPCLQITDQSLLSLANRQKNIVISKKGMQIFTTKTVEKTVNNFDDY